MQEFKCRASAIGNIITGIGFEPIPLTEKQNLKLLELRAKGSKSQDLVKLEQKLVEIPENKLSKGAMTYVQDWWYGQKFEFQKVFTNKYVQKGNQVEGYSITQINKLLGIFATKNKQQFENDFIKGTPDIIQDEFIIDVKNVFYPNGLKFFDADEETNYIWQIHGYNYLTGKNKGYVLRVLVNPPDNILEKLIWTHWNEAGKVGQYSQDFSDEITDLYNFEKLPIEERVRIYPINTSENEIKIIQKAVDLSREYVKELNEIYNQRKVII